MGFVLYDNGKAYIFSGVFGNTDGDGFGFDVKTVSGTVLPFHNKYGRRGLFCKETAYATMNPNNWYCQASSDNSYTDDKYNCTSIGNCTVASVVLNGGVVTMTITYTANSSVTLNSLQFKQWLYSGKDVNNEYLLCGYYLDEPITMNSGDSKTFVLSFSLADIMII